MNGGFTLCQHPRPHSEREHAVFLLIQSSDDHDEYDDDYAGNDGEKGKRNRK